jgi:hypothetical protein
LETTRIAEQQEVLSAAPFAVQGDKSVKRSKLDFLLQHDFYVKRLWLVGRRIWSRLKREIFTVEREQAPYWNQSPLSGADEVGMDPWLLLSSYFILKVNGPTLCHKT